MAAAENTIAGNTIAENTIVENANADNTTDDNTTDENTIDETYSNSTATCEIADISPLVPRAHAKISVDVHHPPTFGKAS